MWLTEGQLSSAGFAALGTDVLIEDSVLLLGTGHMSIGSHVRIDAFCVLSAGPGELSVGDHVHLAVGVKVFAGAGVAIESFVSLSSGVCVYSASDDYSGGALTNPTVPLDLRDVTTRPVSFGRHAIVGAGSVILPGASLAAGASVGALTLVHRPVPENAVVSGNPMRQIGVRDGARLKALEEELGRRERDAQG
jgi:dTDP-4-amino-4,6-dideoxy-D-glucose acyltransferase